MNTQLAMSNQEPVDEHLVDQAIEWLLRVRDDPTGRAEAACRRWRDAHPDHERAWQGVCAVGARLRNDTAMVTPQVATRVLYRASVHNPRRAVLKSLVIGGGVLLGAGALQRYVPWRVWSAQYRTGVGERSEFVLADGASVWLNTDSALDIAEHGEGRTLYLRQGEIQVQTASGTARQPLRVWTPEGLLQPLGTQFNVRLMPADQRVMLVVLKGAVVILPPGQGDEPFLTPDEVARLARQGLPSLPYPVVQAGQQCLFDAARVPRPEAIQGVPTAWRDGMLAASRMPLAHFLAELERYRPGVIQCDPAVADLPVTGAFPLDDTDRVLDALESSLPVHVVRRTRYWVRVNARNL